MKNIPGLATLGAPTSAEAAWASAGGGYVQQFEKGWALIASKGKGGAVLGTGGVLTGAVLDYFRAHGTVTNVGWPDGSGTTVNGGTWQNFTSNGYTAYHGAITSGGSGIFTVKGPTYDYYRSNSLTGAYGVATSETPYGTPGATAKPWYSHGGGYAQYFKGGLVTVAKSGAKGSVLSALVPNLNIGSKGWPTGNTFNQCGGLKVNQEGGNYTSSDNRWCPGTTYAQPAQRAITSGRGQTVVKDMNGIKVWKIQNRLIQLGILKNFRQTTQNSTMGPATLSAVKTFQARSGLEVTGTVGPLTWAKLVGTSPSFDLDAWKQPSLVSTAATRVQRINAMVTWAEQHANRGTPYIWGGTGWWGFDCSGFLLQAMRAGGLDPTKVTNFTDTSPASDLSWRMYLDKEFQTGSFRSLQAGDFIYYGDSSRVRHVAMYIGGGRVVNEDGTKAAYASVSGRVAGWSNGAVWGVNRPFAN